MIHMAAHPGRHRGHCHTGEPTLPEQPLYIRVNDDDNVAIVVNAAGLPAGTAFSSGLTLRDRVPARPQDQSDRSGRRRSDHPLWRGHRHRPSADPTRQFGWRNRWSACRTRPRWRTCRWRAACRPRQPPLEAIRSRATVMLTARWERRTCWDQYQRAVASRARWEYAAKRIRAELLAALSQCR